MLSPARLFHVLSELLFVLLGLLLVQVALSGRLLFDRRSPWWIGLGAVLVCWGVRAWARAGRYAGRRGHIVRGASLALVGAVVIAIAWVPFTLVGPLLALAGAALVLRGITSAILAWRAPEPPGQ
jgi:hypothetical protein